MGEPKIALLDFTCLWINFISKKMEGLPANLPQALKQELIENGTEKTIPAGHELLRTGQYVKVIPFVLSGLIKVFSRHEDKELLLYYIRPEESCIMSFAAGLRNDPSQVYAHTEEETRALLLPVDKVSAWTQQYPDINTLFFQQFNLRYADLLGTIQHILFDKLDKRIYDYLVRKAEVTGHNPIRISHKQIATELGTAREVVSRVIKKLEADHLITQQNQQIKLR